MRVSGVVFACARGRIRATFMQEVTIRIPASTSNLGPGFDCLGVALKIYNTVIVRRGRGGAKNEMIHEAAMAFFSRSGRKPFAFSAKIAGDVPISRGLGSSVTVRLGILHGLNELAGQPLKREAIFQVCAELEGHPDNAAPAEFGGFNVARPGRATLRRRGDRRADRAERSTAIPYQHSRFPVSSALKFILLVPDFEVRTKEARALLPERLPRLDAVKSCGNACAITAAFAAGRLHDLSGAFEDRLHQPYRKRLVPFFDQAVGAAQSAGALGAFLSGSGSTICALTLVRPERVVAAMAAAAPPAARLLITTADNRGVRMVRR